MNPSHAPASQPIVSEASFARDVDATKAALDAQPKKTVRLHQVPADSTDRPLPDEYVEINGHGYLIQRGVDVEVPESVREVLIQAGRY